MNAVWRSSTHYQCLTSLIVMLKYWRYNIVNIAILYFVCVYMFERTFDSWMFVFVVFDIFELCFLFLFVYNNIIIFSNWCKRGKYSAYSSFILPNRNSQNMPVIYRMFPFPFPWLFPLDTEFRKWVKNWSNDEKNICLQFELFIFPSQIKT